MEKVIERNLTVEKDVLTPRDRNRIAKGMNQYVFGICLIENKFVFVKRKSGGLGFPGGGVEKGETPLQAVKREIKEETDVDVKKARLFGKETVHICGKVLRGYAYKCELCSKPAKKGVVLASAPRKLEFENQFWIWKVRGRKILENKVGISKMDSRRR